MAQSQDQLPMPNVKPYTTLFLNRGVTYSCPWEFNLPNPILYSKHVVTTRGSRDSEPTKEELEQHRMPICTFPKFKANTVSLTWLGHASCLFTFFGEEGSDAEDAGEDEQRRRQERRTVRVLCDPNFSDFVGVMGVGSKRHIPAACGVDDLPEIDALCISHNHMDHMDQDTLQKLAKKMPDIQCYIPMGDLALMKQFGFRNVHEMTWWQYKNNLVPDKSLSVRFTPASHWSGRGLRDRNCSLWGSFVLQSHSHKVFFAGDTGYQDQIFKLIGKEHGPFSLAAIPIGCYEPREVFEVQHVDPKHAVQIHREVGSKLSVGIHWGAFRMTTCEGVLQPPEDLERELAAANEGQARRCEKKLANFVAIKVGDSRCWPEVDSGTSQVNQPPSAQL